MNIQFIKISFLFSLGIVFFVGCSDAKEKLFPVTGTVTYRKTPVATGMVMFQPESGKTRTANINATGVYEANIPAGKFRVAVVSKGELPDGKDLWKKNARLPKSLVPEKFGKPESSGVVIEVLVDQSEPINISLN